MTSTTTVKLSATGALTLMLSMASGWVVVSLLHWPPLQTLGGLVCVGVLGSVTIHTMVSRRLKELSLVGAELGDLTVAAAQQSRHQRDQNSLDRNLDLLRRILSSYGEPSFKGGRLYFGNRCINGDFEAVDRVKAEVGGTATIFMGDERVATNVMTPDGSRAIGTTLAQGRARDSVLIDSKLFRGEAEIFGAPHFTIYEPIISDGKTIGILYVGVKKTVETAAVSASGSMGELPGMMENVAELRKTMLAQAEASQEAISQRQIADDSRRHDDIARQTAAAEQRNVVRMLADGLENLAMGNLVFRLEQPFSSEYEKLRTDFNLAMQKLHEAIRIVVSTADGIRSGAEEITSAADDLASRTEHQAASLEQTVVALDEITATVKKTADGAGHARDVVSTAHSNTERMRTIVDSAISAMSRIDKSSEQISQIIGMIDEIAFQTNLLALNAGVEAARAGDSGRGFAVVASEVRALAQRSASAAKQIKTLISVSVEQVQQGVALVGETGASLEHTMKQVREIDEIVTEIAASAREQSNGLHEVNTAINQMDQVTQQNAAMVEESTAASHGLAQDTKHLAELVAKFKVEEDGSVRKADRPPERASLTVMAGGLSANHF